MSSLVKRILQNVGDLPWDKVFPGLVTGLLIYIGAARLSDFGESLTMVRIGMTKYEALQHEYVTRDEFVNLQDKCRTEQFQQTLQAVRLDETLKRQILDLEHQIQLLDQRLQILSKPIISGRKRTL